eukprot:2551304-Pleurochrysis_carterae.AAC.2
MTVLAGCLSSPTNVQASDRAPVHAQKLRACRCKKRREQFLKKAAAQRKLTAAPPLIVNKIT